MKQYGPCIYRDTSTKGNGKHHDCWRADVTIRGIRYRQRNKDRYKLLHWLRGLMK